MGRVGWCRPGVDVATEARKISARGPARPSDAARTLVHHPPHGAKKLRDCDTRESRFPANLHLIRGGVVPRTNVVRGRISRERNSIQMTTVMNVGASTATDARTAGQEAARAIMDGIGDCAPQLCILLASAGYDLHAVLEDPESHRRHTADGMLDVVTGSRARWSHGARRQPRADRLR